MWKNDQYIDLLSTNYFLVLVIYIYFIYYSTDTKIILKTKLLFSLKTTGRLMELNHSDGKLEVQYDENLVKLIREVRQFQGLGFNIPSKIQSTSTKAMKFYQQAIILKQVHILTSE